MVLGHRTRFVFVFFCLKKTTAVWKGESPTKNGLGINSAKHAWSHISRTCSSHRPSHIVRPVLFSSEINYFQSITTGRSNDLCTNIAAKNSQLCVRSNASTKLKIISRYPLSSNSMRLTDGRYLTAGWFFKHSFDKKNGS